MFQEYFGMSGKEVFRRLPSYIRGSVVQTVLSHMPSKKFKYETNRPNIVLVPGLFCSPSVFNRLGSMMEDRVNVFTPPPFPYYHSIAINTANLEQTSNHLLKYLKYLKSKHISVVSLVGHSYGGLICLSANQTIDSISYPITDKLICMATPLYGSPFTKLLPFIPACKQMVPGNDKLYDLALNHGDINTVLVAEKDSTVPPESQIPYMYQKIHRMEGYQHMDFYAGTKQQVKETADILVRQCGR